MQGMKADTAATSIIYRISQQVIQINQHRGTHYQPRTQEILAKKTSGYCCRHQQVQQQVNG